jgi:hypothetical protein
MGSNLYRIRISGALAAAGCLVLALATVASANNLVAAPVVGHLEPAEILPVPNDNAPSTMQTSMEPGSLEAGKQSEVEVPTENWGEPWPNLSGAEATEVSGKSVVSLDSDSPLKTVEASQSVAEALGKENASIAAAPAPDSTATAEPKKWGVGVRAQASTLGLFGVDAGYMFSDRFHARLGFDVGGFGYNTTNSGVDYDANASLSNIHLLGDYFPFGSGLRLTGGLIFQNNRLTGNAKTSSNGTVTLDGQTYSLGAAGQVSNIAAEASYGSGVAPYLGIGYGTPISPGLSFNAELGFMFPGSPSVRLTPTVSPLVPQATADQIIQQTRQQEATTNRDIAGFTVYPVLSIGLSYAF